VSSIELDAVAAVESAGAMRPLCNAARSRAYIAGAGPEPSWRTDMCARIVRDGSGSLWVLYPRAGRQLRSSSSAAGKAPPWLMRHRMAVGTGSESASSQTHNQQTLKTNQVNRRGGGEQKTEGDVMY